ncbi:hypothetical protein P8X24_07475 [Pyrococcus kukulkanii]|uniref:hypothetical protein n=1 Tax=Pyrococcus kukulkanii TaxID=1609559 RepID=UPI0035642473
MVTELKSASAQYKTIAEFIKWLFSDIPSSPHSFYIFFSRGNEKYWRDWSVPLKIVLEDPESIAKEVYDYNKWDEINVYVAPRLFVSNKSKEKRNVFGMSNVVVADFDNNAVHGEKIFDKDIMRFNFEVAEVVARELQKLGLVGWVVWTGGGVHIIIKLKMKKL